MSHFTSSPYTSSSAFSPAPSAFSPDLPLGTAVRDVFRCGAVHGILARTGEPAAKLELFDRNNAVTAAALWAEIPQLPVPGATVHVEGILIPTSSGKPAIWLKSCEPVQILDHTTCVFETVPPSWVTDHGVLDRAVALWETLPPRFRRLVNAVFRLPEVLRAFLAAPASVRHHHNYDGGCIEHSVETAQWGYQLAGQDATMSAAVLVTSLLLHDVGKVYEYVCYRDKAWYMSRQGKLIGHKMTTVMIVSEAMNHCPDLSPDEKVQILHVLASSFAPAYAGFRRPNSKEARVAAAVDSLSAAVGTHA